MPSVQQACWYLVKQKFTKAKVLQSAKTLHGTKVLHRIRCDYSVMLNYLCWCTSLSPFESVAQEI
jgi:hypothetical protein